jgi:hypothetical protein
LKNATKICLHQYNIIAFKHCIAPNILENDRHTGKNIALANRNSMKNLIVDPAKKLTQFYTETFSFLNKEISLQYFWKSNIYQK